jgi:acyl-CoA thioester hydrolase
MERSGITLAVSDASLRFLGSARYDDRVHVFTTLSELRSRGMRFAYRIVNADTGRTLVTASTALIALDATGRPSRLPVEVLEVLSGQGPERVPASGELP